MYQIDPAAGAAARRPRTGRAVSCRSYAAAPLCSLSLQTPLVEPKAADGRSRRTTLIAGGLHRFPRPGLHALANRLCHGIASLNCPFGLFPIPLKRCLEVLRIDLLHVAKRLTIHQPI